MRTLSPHHCARLLVMVLVVWAVVWGVSLSVAAPEGPAEATAVPLVFQDEQYRCYPGDPKSAAQADALRGFSCGAVGFCPASCACFRRLCFKLQGEDRQGCFDHVAVGLEECSD